MILKRFCINLGLETIFVLNSKSSVMPTSFELYPWKCLCLSDFVPWSCNMSLIPYIKPGKSNVWYSTQPSDVISLNKSDTISLGPYIVYRSLYFQKRVRIKNEYVLDHGKRTKRGVKGNNVNGTNLKATNHSVNLSRTNLSYIFVVNL